MNITDNVVQVLKELSSTQKGITLITADEKKKFISYHDLWNRSFYVRKKMDIQGIKRGTEVIILCEDNEFFLYSLWACILGGYVAIPLDVTKDSSNEAMIDSILETLNSPVIICDNVFEKKGDLTYFPIMEYLEDIRNAKDYTDEEVEYHEDAIMYVQYSSGTTKKPRGAAITGANVTANTYDIIKHYQADEKDRFLSLSPLSHCFGLVAFHFVPILSKSELCLISTKLYMNKPLIWAEMIHEYRATRVASLPFALKHFIDIYRKSQKNFKWDFSHVKNLVLGGEQVNYNLCQEFCSCMKKYGFGIEKIIPMYGLSEGTVCVSTVPFGQITKTYQINQSTTSIGADTFCQEVREPEKVNTFLVEVGTVLDHVRVSIRDDDFRELADGKMGYIYVSGPSVCNGYYKDKEATEEVFKDGTWLNTGDVGFLYRNHLVIAGREKELVVSNGKKIACILIEEVVQKVLSGTSYYQCVVCNGMSQINDSEKVIVFIRSDQELDTQWKKREFIDVSRRICAEVFEKTGITIKEVIPVREIPRTGSGKAFRRKLTEQYNLGIFKESDRKLKEMDKTDIRITKKSDSKYIIEEKLVQYIEENFQVKVSDLDVPIFEYGVVSINIPAFIEVINEYFQVNMRVGDIFTYFTLSKIADHIVMLQREVKETVYEQVKVDRAKDEKIAIVGMGCRFPGGANSIEQFWELLSGGKDGISDVPKDRWDVEKYYDQDRQAPGKACNKKGGYLDCGIDEFDARFFNISPKEANALDPQQRILLEVTWEAFENANMNIEQYNGSNTGVYVGICNNEYYLSQTQSGDLTTINPYSLTGCSWSTACGRISYTFGFEGPCASVDTACSSALTALHFACTALKTGEADMQVVAGVNLIESPTTGIGFSKLQATCPDGYCKSFDASANGYARGEGCGVILLKRLSDAIRDENEILAVVRATGINQDGKSNGLTAPNGESQEKLIQTTMARGGVTSDSIDYVEMHGTGTKLGDPIEVNAVASTYGANRTQGNTLKIGSVKSNIGHLESAAGTASIIKVLLALKHNMIPANLHFNEPNPLIDWERSQLEVVDHNTVWAKKDSPRMAAVNGFGFGGSNAHVILEEYKGEESAEADETQDGMDFVLKITAQSEPSLNQLIQTYYDLLETSTDEEIADIVYTANRGRADLSYRFLVTGNSRTMLMERMKTYLENGFAKGVICNAKDSLQKDRKSVFMFTGQGSQYVRMGKLLYETNPVFQDAMDECDQLFRPYILKSILDLVYGAEADEAIIAKTVFAQPLIFSVEYALYQVWKDLGVKPELVMGHSIGEYAAAVAAGIMSLEDAVKLVSARGRLMDMAPGHGKMATIFAKEEVVNELLKGYEHTVCIAAKNAKENNVIAGASEDVEALVKKAIEAGYRAKELVVSHAFHSMLMEPILDDFYAVAKAVTFHEPTIRFVSALYGKELEQGQTLNADYWTNHIRAEVDFYEAISSIDTKQNYLFLEVGSNRVLAALAKMTFGDSQKIASTLSMKQEEKEYLPQQIAEVYASGVNINWNKLHFAGKKHWTKVTLPNYPYNKKKYWMELKYDRSTANVSMDECHPILGQRVDLSTEKDSVIYQTKFSTTEPYFMSEHIIFDVSISPAAAHTSMLLSAIQDTSNPMSCSLQNIEFRAPLAAKGEEERQVQIYLEKEKEEARFKISSRDYNNKQDKWLLHAQGKAAYMEQYQNNELKVDTSKFEKLTFEENVEDTIYDYMRSTGFWLGDGFRRITKLHKQENECICLIEPLKTVPRYQAYILYPGLIDSIFQSGLALILDQLIETSKKEAVNKTIIPYYVEKLTFNYRESEKLWCHTKSEIKNNVIYVDIMVYNEKGEVLMKVDHMLIKLTNSKSLLREMETLDKQYYHMDWKTQDEYASPRKDLKDVKTVVFAEKEDTLGLLTSKFQQQGADVAGILSGTSFEKRNENEFVIRPEEKADWSQVFRSLSKSGADNGFQMVYCNENAQIINAPLEDVSYSGVRGLFHVIQVITKEGYLRNTKITIVTKDVQNLELEEKQNLAGSMIWGFAKTVSIEYPEIYGGIVDVDDAAMENDKLLASLLGVEPQESVVRGQTRYIARLISHKDYLKQNKPSDKKIEIKEDASYLITGGTGALANVYAKQLIKEGAKNLILVSRHEPEENAKEQMKQFREQGVNVVCMQGDVCNAGSILRVIEESSNAMPPIRGVIHTAGVLHDKMMVELDWSEFQKVLEPKVAGTVHLYQAVKKKELDFFMMLSSITSVTGNMGQANYGAANGFMNAFAAYLRKQNVLGCTFCWGPWSEGGMAVSNHAISSNLERMGIKPIDKEQGQKMIEEFFQKPYETMLLADVDWDKLNDSMKQAIGKEEFLSELITKKVDIASQSKKQDTEQVREKLKMLPDNEKKAYLCEKLQDVFGKIMGFDKGQLSIEEGVSEQGADSLMIFSMNAAVNQMLELNLTVSVFFEYPSITRLVDYLLKEVL